MTADGSATPLVRIEEPVMWQMEVQGLRGHEAASAVALLVLGSAFLASVAGVSVFFESVSVLSVFLAGAASSFGFLLSLIYQPDPLKTTPTG